VLRKQVLAEQPESSFLQAQQRVGLHDLVINLGFGGLTVESAYRDGAGKKHEFVLKGIATRGVDDEEGQNEE
jgi:hypothetical protein